jgi:hypothetical protein
LACGSLLATIVNSFLSEDNKIRNSIVSILSGFTAFVCYAAQTSYLNSGDVQKLMLPLMLIGALCDIVFIIVTRQLIRWAGEMNGVSKVSGVVILNILSAVCLLRPGLVITAITTNIESHVALECVAVVSLSNIFDGFLALLFVVLVFVLLIHRLLWPLLSRTLFRMQDIGTRGRRSILTAIGFALLWLGAFGGKFPDLLKEIMKSFNG